MSNSETVNFYNVVFVCTEKAGAYAGTITWMGYPSKEEFESLRKGILADGRQKVLAEGISAEEAVRLSITTSMVVRMRVARYEATDPKTGEFNLAIYEMHLSTAMWALCLG